MARLSTVLREREIELELDELAAQVEEALEEKSEEESEQ